jgi:hypothetical protein
MSKMKRVVEARQEELRAQERAARAAEEKRMIENPDSWPQFVLPVKRYTEENPHVPECALLVPRNTGDPHKVFAVNLFAFADAKVSLASYPYLEYQTTAELQAAGWVVD